MIKVIGLNIKVLKKEPFSGSHQGMRFFMRAEDDTLHVWVYPEPWCFEKTSDDMKTAKDFPLPRRDWMIHWNGSARNSKIGRITGCRWRRIR